MSLGVFVFAWLAAFSGPADQGSLGALAAASGRPKECMSATAAGRRAKKLTVWQRARYPKLAAYCDQVARAHALLEGDAKGSLEAADAALQAWTMAGGHVARGRALFALGKNEEALAAFEAAKKADAGAVEDPKAMRDHARVLARSGKRAEAAAVYRVLVPRAELLGDRARVEVLLEAAFASMSAEAAEPAAKDVERLAEALAYLAEARQDEASPLAAEALLATALVHDRRGDPAKATSLAAEAAREGADASRAPWVAEAADREALAALALEAGQPAAAAEAWAKYLDAAKASPWAEAAKARQAALRAKKTAAPPKPKKKGAKP